MPPPPQNNDKPQPAAAQKPGLFAVALTKAKAKLSQGKTAAALLLVLLLMVIAAVWLPRAVVFYRGWSADASPAEFWGVAAVFVVLLLLAASLFSWARNFLFGGWAISLLVVIGAGEITLRDIWQGYTGSALDKITDYVYGVLILWLALAWRGKAIMEWLEGGIKRAAQAPVDAVNKTVGDAVQTVKSTAEESVGKLTKGITSAAESVKETADKSVDKLTEGLDKTTEAVKGTADTIADSAKSFGQKIYSAVGEGIDTATKAPEKAWQLAKETADDAAEGASNIAGGVKTFVQKPFIGDSKQPNKDAQPDKSEGDKGAATAKESAGDAAAKAEKPKASEDETTILTRVRKMLTRDTPKPDETADKDGNPDKKP